MATKVAKLDDRLGVPGGGILSRGESADAAKPSPHGWLWWAVYLALWTGIVFLATLAALRIFFHDATYVLTWFNAFTRYLYLPAYPALVWALWQRRWVLTVVCLVVVACHMTWMAPNFLRDRRFDVPPEIAAAADPSPTVRIFFANVLGSNDEYEALLAEIAEADPDVVILAEFTYGWYLAFQQSPVMAGYTHGTSAARRPRGMLALYSKLPLNSEMENWVANRLVRTVDVQIGPKRLRLIGLHAPRPMYLSEYDYAGFWGHMVPLLTIEEGPLVVVGDYNATEHSLVYKQLQQAGLRSAHDDRGRGYATTWPNGHNLVPPIRIDQAFISPEVECERIVEGRGKGSDHKPLILDVRLRDVGTR